MEVDFERKNAAKTRFYQLFQQLVEPSVIDMVLEGCQYEENSSYKKLSDMCGHRAPPMNSVPRNPIRSAHDPSADNHRASPPNSNLAHNAFGDQPRLFQQGHDPGHDNQRTPPFMVQHLYGQPGPAGKLPSPGLQPTAPQISFYQPPPYQTNPPLYSPRPLYPALPHENNHQALPAPPPPPFAPAVERSLALPKHVAFVSVQQGDDNDDSIAINADLFYKLQLLRQIVQTVNERRSKAEIEFFPGHLQHDEKRGEAAALAFRGFPQYWPRNDRGATILPVKGDLRTEIATTFKQMQRAGINVEIQAIEELCNFNLYEDFVVQKHCIEEQKKPLNERQLWYYPRLKDVENICYQGIDFKSDLKDGPVGSGKYFFKSPAYAHSAFAKNLKKDDIAFMFLCEVNAGRMIKGKRDNDFVPLDEEGHPYECSVDSLDDPAMFILHEKNNCYPRYMITYKVKPSVN